MEPRRADGVGAGPLLVVVSVLMAEVLSQPAKKVTKKPNEPRGMNKWLASTPCEMKREGVLFVPIQTGAGSAARDLGTGQPGTPIQYLE